MKVIIFLLFILLSGNAHSNDVSTCLMEQYDKYATNRIALFAKARVLYKSKFTAEYTVYGPILIAHALFTRINQYVFHYFMQRDISKLKLNHGITNSVPNWVKDACSGRNCVNRLHIKLSKSPQFDKLYSQWSRSRKKTKEAYHQKKITQAGKLYFQLLKDDAVRPHAIKDMAFYGVKVSQLCS